MTESEIEKNLVTDNITLLAEKLKQISLDCPGQFNIQSLKISSQFGCLIQHSLTNSHQVIHIQSKYFKSTPILCTSASNFGYIFIL